MKGFLGNASAKPYRLERVSRIHDAQGLRSEHPKAALGALRNGQCMEEIVMDFVGGITYTPRKV